MSLVYEALQKAEREKQRKTGVAPAPLQAPSRTESAPIPTQEGKDRSSSASAREAVSAVRVADPNPQTRSHQPLVFGLIATVTVVALVAIVYLVANAVKPSSNTSSMIVTNTIITTAAVPVVATTTPTVPPSLSPMDPRFQITGIMRKDDGKYGAVINGKIVYEGHYLEGATVKTITEDRAILDLNGREIVVRLF